MIHNNKFNKVHAIGISVLAITTFAGNTWSDQVILDDLIVDGSQCVGVDCVNGESFGFDTIRLKENNLRIKFQDTSSTASFPTNDWQITANDSSNGGANKFSIDDIDGGRTPFTIEAGAPSHSLYVDDGGRIGLGTSTPVVEIHNKDGDTPTLRLEQDGSSGFTPQTWDMAGNETNFFIRDVTNGSRLPFRIRPGAPTNSIYVDVDGDVGLGTSSPQEDLHVHDTSGTDVRIMLTHSGTGTSRYEDGSDITLAGDDLYMVNRENGDTLFYVNDQSERLRLDNDGDNEITGNLNVTGDITSDGTTVVPDYVFEDSYKLMSLSELQAFIEKEKHLPNVPSSSDVARDGLNHNEFQMALLEKIEELTLYTLRQQQEIDTLRTQIAKSK